jgi:hypothetical protein
VNADIITPAEVAVLQGARLTLEAIRSRNHGTVVQGTADVAEHAVFSVLNHCNSYLDADLTYEELHGSPNPEAVPA